MEKKVSNLDRALRLFSEGCNCAQATLEGIAPENLSSEQMQLIGSAFGGGIARSGRTCGAVTGAMMAIGLKYGYTLDTKKSQSKNCVSISQQFLDRFESEFGTSICKDLIGFDISTEEQKDAASKTGVFDTKCPKYVAAAIKMAQEIEESSNK